MEVVNQAPSPLVITRRLARAVGMCACGFHNASPWLLGTGCWIKGSLMCTTVLQL